MFKKAIKILLDNLAIVKVNSLKAKKENKSLFNEIKKYSNMNNKSVVNKEITNSRNFFKK